MTSYENTLNEAVRHLELARELLLREISTYPTPIAGCDAQFNHLLSDRTRLSKALAALEDRPFVPTPRALRPGAVSESR